MTSVYIAGRYSRKDELNGYANQARSAGLQVTATWLEEPHAPTVQMVDVTEASLRHYAITDENDIRRAEAVVFFAEDQNKQPPRGGRHVEFGLALGLNKRLIVVGAPENIFHYHPGVLVVTSWQAALDALCAQSVA